MLVRADTDRRLELVRRHLPGFLARLEEGGHSLPEFVKKELASSA
jgi:hypothetical protein